MVLKAYGEMCGVYECLTCTVTGLVITVKQWCLRTDRMVLELLGTAVLNWDEFGSRCWMDVVVGERQMGLLGTCSSHEECCLLRPCAGRNLWQRHSEFNLWLTCGTFFGRWTRPMLHSRRCVKRQDVVERKLKQLKGSCLVLQQRDLMSSQLRKRMDVVLWEVVGWRIWGDSFEVWENRIVYWVVCLEFGKSTHPVVQGFSWKGFPSTFEIFTI